MGSRAPGDWMWPTVSDVMSALRKKIWLVVFTAFVSTGVGRACAAELTPAEVKAAYLRYIAELTTWPGDPVAGVDQPILIGVIGDDPNGVMNPIRAHLENGEDLLAQKRPIRLVDLQVASDDGEDPEGLASCALIFLSEGSKEDWERIQPAVNALPIVTVSEIKGFAERGGMIEYFIDRRTGKVRLKINLRSTREAGITLSARILTLRTVILLGEREGA